jgi:hypothetical protein
MAVVIGIKQQVKTYQTMQETNNYTNINSKLSSNIIYLNTELHTLLSSYINYSFEIDNNILTNICNEEKQLYLIPNNLRQQGQYNFLIV